ncbi:paraquat-inducible protein B [Vibrio parahaemolyticus]|uniref:intermembrane transport protein PqiB n=1 Tax=Vibrio parahaemolyticus TaxID=670 RepID=UPI0011200C39|nr:intermembrane transport protein PqiB [Vibrio parahaemolyticus]EGQ8098101.1 intermembrane transport protein PqiB [Vibrio parahaemolyticus]EGQ9288702.1 intermembrane transport protein PqiB [Vibrio parahaemolyticus]TOQ81434.1 paraquat-inducible protein B [Vibrio parahaemolyticus]
MSDENNATAQIKPQKQISAIWIVPILALAMGAWMLFQYINSTGPQITLQLPTADGIEVGKTEIRALNVKVGLITEVTLSENYDHIIAKAQMNKDAERMLRDDTMFWVVKPRIGRDGVSGLETLLSGAYIQLQPGSSEVEKDHFAVLDVPPVASPDAEGLRIVLTHREAGKLGVGDPVIYKGFTVGRVEKTSFDVDTRRALYQLFIFKPYDNLVRTRTKFWLNSGLDLQLNAEGFEVKFGSLESLLTGGVTFDSIPGMESGEALTKDMTNFRLYDDVKQVREGMYDEYIEFVMLFEESVRGLKRKAPVEYRGLRIGTVMRVPMRLPTPEEHFSAKRIPVLVRIELGRVYGDVESHSMEMFKEKLKDEFAKGLRGTLKTGNLLTGALYIDADFYPDDTPYEANTYEGLDVFPTMRGGFAQVQRQVNDFLNKLNNLPMEDTLTSLNATLKTSERTLASAEKVANSIDKLLSQKDTQEIPADIRQSLQQLQKTLDGYGPNSTMYSEMESTLKELEKVMTEFKPVLKQLNEKPNSLVFGEDEVKDPIPVRGQQ